VSTHVRRAGRGAAAQRAVLLGPGLAWWFAFFAIPVALVLATSFLRRGPFGGVVAQPTLENYARVLDPIFLRVLGYSLRVALAVTAVALVIGYPAAYFIATLARRWRAALLVLVVLPFWTSFLIRTYAWIVLLNREGLVNRTLVAAGVLQAPLPLLNNTFAIVVGLVYAYLPLMILPIYSAIERLGVQAREAAADLGAPPASAFLRVTLPLTLRGVLAGCTFVFVPSLGNFIVPDLLGGGRRIMIGNLIQQQFLQARDWPFGATLAILVLVPMLILLRTQVRVLRRDGTVSTDG
jgi:spermidine/putrescine transport system permease protein